MPEYQPPVDDVLYLLRHVIDSEKLLSLPGFAHVDQDMLEDVVRGAGRVAADIIAPMNEASDREGATYANGRCTLSQGFADAYKQVCTDGWPSLVLPEAWGGQAMPEIAQAALSEFSNGASLAFSMLTTTGRSSARVLEAHATDALRDLYMPKLVSGEWTATIVMTEPHAGSDIGLARTKAVPQDDGTYTITGTKIFISFGDHDATEQICHIVLARTEDAPEGVRGLSLFLVPKFIPDADGSLGEMNSLRPQRIEAKLGIHGSPTCEMLFDGATGWLLGDELRGIQNMFTMINTMRLEVAFEAIGVAGAALGNAVRYAAERPQGRGEGGDGPVAIIEHPDVRRMLMTMKAGVDGSRALGHECAAQLDLSRHAESDEDRRDAGELLAFLLPICKAAFSDAAVQIANLGIQVHGGHGYVEDNWAEFYLRESRILPIYEGTNGIQAIDLVTRKLPREDGHAFKMWAERIADDLDRTAGAEGCTEIHAAVDEGLALLTDCTRQIFERLGGQGNNSSGLGPRDALSGASPYLALAGRIGLGWMHLRMAAVDTPQALADPLVAEKRTLARFYATQMMSDVPGLMQQALSTADLLDDLSVEALARI